MKLIAAASLQKKLWMVLLLLPALILCLAARPAVAAPQGTYVSGPITTNTTWTTQGSPYQVDSYVDVVAGVTLTIQAGVTVENYGLGGSTNYQFTVEGTLLAVGTAAQPVRFNPGPSGWSGIIITGQPDAINTGSGLSYVIVEGGGFGGTSVAANLHLQYASVNVDHSEFNNSPGDGFLGETLGVAHFWDSSFHNNQGYAVNYEDGSVNPTLSNLAATGNGPSLPYGGNLVVINDGTLHGSHHWESMGLPYLILQTTVAQDGVLLIDPGVQVLAQPGNNALDVQGVIVAVGTPDQRIFFDPADPLLGWSGIALYGGVDPETTNGEFRYVTIHNAGSTGNCGLYASSATVWFYDSVMTQSMGDGICAANTAVLVAWRDQLIDNLGYPINLIDPNSPINLKELSASGNGHDAIGVEGGTLQSHHTWSKSGIDTFDLHYGSLTIDPTGYLYLYPGLTIQFGQTSDITVQGSLQVFGAADDPITFTAETPTPGFWSGINFSGTAGQHAQGRFAYANLEYTGYGGSAAISIYYADVEFMYAVSFRHCAGDGVVIYPDAAGDAGPTAPATNNVAFKLSNLDGVDGYAIRNLTGQSIQAMQDWWGSPSGPTADDNPGGTGSAIYGLVDYRPFTNTPITRVIFIPVAVRP